MKRCCSQAGKGTRNEAGVRHIVLAGNPNCGKSTLFNALVGARQKTANWPGVTVERHEGRLTLDDGVFRLIDLPGLYTFDSGDDGGDEAIAREYLLHGPVSLVVNVIDASNLERSLYLTSQLLELGVPLVCVLNMSDVARQQGVSVDAARLSRRLGCPVVACSAHRGEGVEALRGALADALDTRGHYDCLRFPPPLEGALARLQAGSPPSRRGRARAIVQMLNADEAAPVEGLDEDPDILVADARYEWAHGLCAESMGRRPAGATVSDRVDELLLHRWLGLPLFLLVMYAMFVFTISIGGAFIDFFDLAGGALFVDTFGRWLDAWGAPAWLGVLLADGVGGGVQVVATFIPIIACLYLFLSVLEDSGYLARAAVVMDGFMRRLGLPGKAFVPLIVGFGCNVPAIMAVRTLETSRARLMTAMMAPFMSCGARLSVYALFAAAFFPRSGGSVVFALYLVGILVAVGTAWLLKSTVSKGEAEPFVLELPAYHRPTVKGVLLQTWRRLKGFVVDAGRLIVLMVVVINVLNSVGTDGGFGHENSGHSVLSAVARGVTPWFEPMGLEDDNWPASVGILTGVLAKEVVVGTLDAIYGQMDAGTGDPNGVSSPPEPLASQLRRAWATIPANLAAVLGSLHDPLELEQVSRLGAPAEAAAAQDVSTSTFTAMAARFNGQAGAFAYLLFILLYSPCIATIAAIYRELGGRWAVFAVGWSTAMAYAVATLFYQWFSPQAGITGAVAWSVFIAVVLGAFIWLMRHHGRPLTESPA